MIVDAWAKRHGVSDAALRELRELLGAVSVPTTVHHDAKSEAGVQSRERLAASENGGVLWRNNVGACKDEKGNFLRYGLANDSTRINKTLKSSDLIGIAPTVITQGMVGTVIGRFWAVECKQPGWRYTETDREKAQLNFLTQVTLLGGLARFAS